MNFIKWDPDPGGFSWVGSGSTPPGSGRLFVGRIRVYTTRIREAFRGSDPGLPHPDPGGFSWVGYGSTPPGSATLVLPVSHHLLADEDPVRVAGPVLQHSAGLKGRVRQFFCGFPRRSY